MKTCAENLPNIIAKLALVQLTDEPSERLAADWVKGLLPPLRLGESKDIRSAVARNQPILHASLDLLARHLAKDVPLEYWERWLMGCEQTGVLCDCDHTLRFGCGWIWSPEPDKAKELVEKLRRKVDQHLPEPKYRRRSWEERTAIYTSEALDAEFTNVMVRFVLLAQQRDSVLNNRPEYQRRHSSSEEPVPSQTADLPGVTESRFEIKHSEWEEVQTQLAKVFGAYPLPAREYKFYELRNKLNESGKGAESCGQFSIGSKLPHKDLVIKQLWRRVHELRYWPPEQATHCPPSLPESPLPLEVITPDEFATVPLHKCLWAGAGPAARAAEAAVTSRLLFHPDPDGPKVVFHNGPLPDHLWVVGDIHADILAMENAWQFICSQAARDGVEPAVLFLGDFIDRGRFDHITLVRLFRLVAENPCRVGVLVGNHDEALRWDAVVERFAADIEPAEYKDELNGLLAAAAAGDIEAADRVAVGKAAVRFFARCPRAVLLTDGTLFAHGGFPHTDLLPTLMSVDDLEAANCLQDFVWLRASRNAPQKKPNRHSRGCEFGANDFAEFCRRMVALGRPVRRLIRGHDHVPNRCDLPPRYAAYPVVTINTLSRRLVDEFNTDLFPPACVARHRPNALPIVYRLQLDRSEVLRAFPNEERG
ncbi:MAG: metallophosphoesterase [Fimbriiglobus sp.]